MTVTAEAAAAAEEVLNAGCQGAGEQAGKDSPDDGSGTPKAAVELLFKVASATVGMLAYEAGKGAAPQPGLPLATPEAKAAKGSAPPCTPQKQPQQLPKGRRSPKSGQTPATRTPQTTRSPLADEDDDSEADSMIGGDFGSSPAKGSSVSSGVSPKGGFDGAGGKGFRQRRQPPRTGGYGGTGMSPSSGAGRSPYPREFKPPPPPPSGSLKALPAEHVQRFLRLVQEGDYAEALRALRKVRRAVKGRGCSKEAFGGLRALLHHLLEGYSSAGRLTEALELLGDMKRGTEARLVSAAAFNAVLRGLLARGALDEARFIVREEMPRLGVSPNEASLNLLMDTAARAGPGHLDEAWDVLEEMQKRSLRADKYTVSILTKGISERGDKRRAPRGVTLVEHFLKTQPEDVDEVLVNSLLDVFCRMGDMPRLEATLQKMKEYGIKGSAVTYGTIVKAYGRAGNIDKVLQAWAEMQKEGLEANAVTYGCMLDACVKCGHLDRALHVFAIMKEQGLHRNTILYATLIKGFAKSKDPLAARDLYREMVSEGVLCNVVVFNSLIDACVRANDLQGAAEVLQQMTAAGVRPDLITFSTLIKGYCSNGELNKAMRLADELQARELESDEIVYNSLLEGCVKAGDLQLGLRLFTEMRQRCVRPSSVTFSILVKLLSRAGRLDLATHLVAREMREMHGVAPTRMVWSCLVTCAVKARDIPRAVTVLELLDREGGAAGGARASMYATVVEGCLVQGEVRTALDLCQRAYLRAPPEEGARGMLSSDLLHRVFEAVSARGPEAEARQVLESIAPRLTEQVKASLEEALKGFRRRSPQGGRERDGGRERFGPCGGAGGEAWSPSADGSGSALDAFRASAAQSAMWPGGVLAAAQGWPQSQSPSMPSSFPGLEALAGGMAAGAFPGAHAQWDPSMMAAAAAAAAGWGWPGADQGYGMGMYGACGADAYYNGGWPAQPWEQPGLNWQVPTAAAAATAPSPTASRAFEGVAATPETPSAAAAAKSPGTEGPSAETPITVSKAIEQTPATTAGRSSLPFSPAVEADDDDKVHKQLFAGDGAGTGANGAAEQATGKGRIEVPLAALLEGPPGLC